MTLSYILTKGAESDLRDITHYTVAKWGTEQYRIYMAALEEKVEAVARGEGAFKDMSSLMPGLRVATSGKHYIFCMPRSNAPAVILAILHERMDIISRLKSRLDV